jgi:hypothetical protein
MGEPAATVDEERFQAFPHWRAFARRESFDDGDNGRVIEVAPPAGAPGAHGGVIDTAHGEITPGFGSPWILAMGNHAPCRVTAKPLAAKAPGRYGPRGLFLTAVGMRTSRAVEAGKLC